MRIAYLYTALTTFGGVDRVLTEKANYLAEVLGHEVYIITDSQAGRPPVFPLSAKVRHVDLETDFDEQYHYGIVKRFLCYRRLMKQYRSRLEKLLLQVKPDITISTCGRDLDFLNTLRDGSIKMGESHTTKAYMRNLYLMRQKGFPFNLVARHWERKMETSIKQLKAFVVLNEHDAESWRPIRPVTIIPNSLPFRAERTSTLRNNRIISVGRLSVEKGADRMIEIWKRLAPKHPTWTLEWFGHGPLQDEIEGIIRKEGLQESFHTNAPTQHIQDEYLNSDIYALCSRFEGFGMVLIEAMSCGLPCVSFDCPHGPRTIIKDREDGFLIPDNDMEAYTACLDRLMQDFELRQRIGQQAKKTSEKYMPEHIMLQWERLFTEVIQNNRHS